jgi:hypothetical protein
LVDADHGLPIYVELGHSKLRLKRKTRRNGHFQNWIKVPDEIIRNRAICDSDGRRYLDFHISTDRPHGNPVRCRTHLLDRCGLSVVSDIDDTIKQSEVIDKRELLANTFLREFRGVEGMADVYNQWYAAGTAFHYVSSSPWQLFEQLQELQTIGGFPPGTLHLRNFRLRDQLLARVLIIRRKGKSSAIRTLLKTMPYRQFVLIGDSGEKDPEIYRKICRLYPGRIKGIFIREIGGRPIDGDRFKKLRHSIPRGRCAKFTSPQTLLTEAAQIFASAPDWVQSGR